MRIHRLSFTAVGPYPGTETIDFDRFGESGRFLLTGPTGAGKTTIIDAIVFALYGEVSGEKESSKDRIRSTLVTPEVETVVELVFSTGSGIYRIRRTPGYERPKKRGSGTTKQNPTVKLWRLPALPGQDDGRAAGELLSTRAEEVGAEITRAVGLRHEQFTQTVVLPQGKFARFLRASSDERHQLLKDVFGTGIYDDVQAQIGQMSREAKRRSEAAFSALEAQGASLGKLLDDVGTEMAQPAESAADTTPDKGKELLPSAVLSTAVQTFDAAAPQTLNAIVAPFLDAAEAAVAQAAQAQADAKEQSTAATEQAQAAEQLQRLLDERRKLLEAQEKVIQAAPAQAEQAERLQQAERAQRTVTAQQAAKRAQEAAQEQLEILAKTVSALADGANTDIHAQALPLLEQVQSEETSECSTDALELLSQQARTDAGALQELVELESALPKRQENLQVLEQEAQTAAQQLTELEEQLASRPEQQQQLSEQLSQAQATAAQIPLLTAALERATAQHTACQAAAQLAKQIEQTQQTLEQAGKTAQSRTEQVHRLRLRWIQATAGSLAGELHDEQPCPVCGSQTHPCPAQPGPDDATREQVEEAEAGAKTADEYLTQVRTKLDSLRKDLQQAQESAGQLEIAQAAEQEEQAQILLNSARKKAQAVEKLAAQLESFQADTESLRKQTEDAKLAQTQLQQLLGSKREQFEADTQRCEQARAGASSVAAQQRFLVQRAKTVESTAQQFQQLKHRLKAQTTAAQDYLAVLQEQGFTDAAQAQQALLGLDELAALKEHVQQAQIESKSVEAGLARPEIAALTGAETADVSGTRERAGAAQAAWEASTAVVERLRAQAQQQRLAASAFLQSAQEYADAVRGSAALLRVSTLAAGGGPTGTDLSTWVLLSRFEEVLVFANQRLAQMSDGRYELMRVDDESGSRARRKGLGLRVIDRFGEIAQRDPRTLSGGETFYVSLSLALALADVVTAESGGITLDTLFIDEGFGTLDPEKLQAVLGELDQLRAGGRTVGVVSHVEELRRQISDRVEVRQTHSGSTLHVVA